MGGLFCPPFQFDELMHTKRRLPTLHGFFPANRVNDDDIVIYSYGYNRYVGALNGDIRGTDVGATLTFSYPLGNNLAKGQRDLANATHNINVINTNDLMRTISVQVGIDASTLMARLKEAVEAKKAVELYAKD